MPQGIYKHKPLSEAHKENIRKALIGRKRPEIYQWMFKVIKKNKSRHYGYWTGKTLSVEHRQKLSESHQGQGVIHGLSYTKTYRAYHSQLRRARVRKLEGTFTLNEWEELKKKYKFTCPSCFKHEPEIKLTIDHIIPISQGGSNDINNIQPLCFSCNSSKNAKTIYFKIPELEAV